MRKWIICVVVGLALLGLGSGVGVNDGRVMCGSEEMSPGDVCEETRRGVSMGTRTYEEMKADAEAGQQTFDSWGRWALLGGGLALTVLGAFGIVRLRRERASGGAAQGSPQVAAPGYPPAQPQSGFPPAQPPGHPPAQAPPGYPPVPAQQRPGFPQPGHPPAQHQPGFPQQRNPSAQPAPGQHQPGFPQQGQTAPGQHQQGQPPFPPPNRQPGPPPNQPPHEFGPGSG
jgi:hypothetical protein